MRTTRRDTVVALALASFVAWGASPAFAQTTPSPASSKAAPPPATPAEPPASKGPSFQSGGLKITVVSASMGAGSIALSLILENKAPTDQLVAVIGPPIAISGGQTWVGTTVGGIASCMVNPGFPRSDQIKSCLGGSTPTLPVQQFTLLEHGNALPLTVSFGGPSGQMVDKTQPISFAMTAAIAKNDESSPSGDTLQTSHQVKDTTAVPRDIRFISLGIPAISPPG